jgi:hypothetical protein
MLATESTASAESSAAFFALKYTTHKVEGVTYDL